MIRKPGLIDQSLVADGFLFATHRDRCLYLGKSPSERPHWLEANPNSFEPIDDVQQEPAQLGSPIENENNAGAAPAAPKQPPPGKMPEGMRSQKETTPLGAVGRKRGRSGGRQLKKQKLPAEISGVRQRRTPARVRLVLDSLSEYPVLSHAARKAGIHRKTLEYWIKRSRAGDDEYDVEWRGETWKFHEHCQSAIEEAEDKLLRAAWDIAMGGVVYKNDERLLALGCEGPDAYLRDENGNPVVETIRNGNSKMLLFLLEWLRPDKRGKHRKIDVPQKGGVLVIGATPKKLKNSTATAASIKARRWKSRSKVVREAKS
jgi:hypothetical protein